MATQNCLDAQKLAAYTRQGGVCKMCGKKFNIDEMNADHIKPWSKGGHTTPDNCQMLCSTCNFTKGAKSSIYLASPKPHLYCLGEEDRAIDWRDAIYLV